MPGERRPAGQVLRKSFKLKNFILEMMLAQR